MEFFFVGKILDALYRKGIRGFGDDDPGNEVGDESDAYRKERAHRNDDANEVHIPVIVPRNPSAHACNHAVFAGAGNWSHLRCSPGHGRRRRRECRSTRGAEAGRRFDLSATVLAVHDDPS